MSAGKINPSAIKAKRIVTAHKNPNSCIFVRLLKSNTANPKTKVIVVEIKALPV